MSPRATLRLAGNRHDDRRAPPRGRERPGRGGWRSGQPRGARRAHRRLGRRSHLAEGARRHDRAAALAVLPGDQLGRRRARLRVWRQGRPARRPRPRQARLLGRLLDDRAGRLQLRRDDQRQSRRPDPAEHRAQLAGNRRRRRLRRLEPLLRAELRQGRRPAVRQAEHDRGRRFASRSWAAPASTRSGTTPSPRHPAAPCRPTSSVFWGRSSPSGPRTGSGSSTRTATSTGRCSTTGSRTASAFAPAPTST